VTLNRWLDLFFVIENSGNGATYPVNTLRNIATQARSLPLLLHSLRSQIPLSPPRRLLPPAFWQSTLISCRTLVRALSCSAAPRGGQRLGAKSSTWFLFLPKTATTSSRTHASPSFTTDFRFDSCETLQLSNDKSGAVAQFEGEFCASGACHAAFAR
jgi:hypothetical protein